MLIIQESFFGSSQKEKTRHFPTSSVYREHCFYGFGKCRYAENRMGAGKEGACSSRFTDPIDPLSIIANAIPIEEERACRKLLVASNRKVVDSTFTKTMEGIKSKSPVAKASCPYNDREENRLIGDDPKETSFKVMQYWLYDPALFDCVAKIQSDTTPEEVPWEATNAIIIESFMDQALHDFRRLVRNANDPKDRSRIDEWAN